MIIFVCIIGLVALLSVRRQEDAFLSIHQTTVINGIFVILIFLSHSTQYLYLSDNLFDSVYGRFQNFHNQWVVTTFLAFSGYGVMGKIKSEGERYLKLFPKRRLLKTLVNFDIAVFAYLVMNSFLGIHYSAAETAGAFIGLTSVGNSNWYIFSILIMYAVTYVAACIFKGRNNSVAMCVTVFSVMYVIAAQMVGLPSRFVSTVSTYALGVWIALYKEQIYNAFVQKPIIWLIVLSVPVLATYRLRGSDYIMNINSCFFVLLVVWFMSHFRVQSKLLYFFGKHAFSIYILQRIPMTVMTHYYIPYGTMKYVGVIGLLFVTVGISVLFDRFLVEVEQRIIINNGTARETRR